MSVDDLWSFSPVVPERYSRLETAQRLVVISAEPNNLNVRPDIRDMGVWFREAPANQLWRNAKFYRATALYVAGTLGHEIGKPKYITDATDLFASVRFLDLNHEGGRNLVKDKKKFREAVDKFKNYTAEIILADSPAAILLLGRHAQREFERSVKPLLCENGAASICRVGLPQPSAYGYHEQCAKEAKKKLRPLSKPLQRGWLGEWQAGP
jgi:hypothetical protein